MKKFLMATICLLLLLVSPIESFACLCRPESAKRAVKRLKKEAGVIFTGTAKVVKRENLDFIVTFTVDKAWKSDGSLKITVKTSGSCRAYFAAEGTYLVYASKDEKGDLRTSLCMRTRRIQDADEDLKHLGKPKDA